jgi:hypothetical protein
MCIKAPRCIFVEHIYVSMTFNLAIQNSNMSTRKGPEIGPPLAARNMLTERLASLGPRGLAIARNFNTTRLILVEFSRSR